jgi:chromosome partitioning protein
MNPTKIIAVLNQKGGVGKTTSVINIAAYLAKAGHQVLVVDLDPQGNATSGLGLDKQSLGVTTYDILFNPTTITESIKQTGITGLSIIGANAALAAAEVDLSAETQREYRLQVALQNLGAQISPATTYDYILIDCPPSLGLLSINALTAADQVLIPVQAEYFALEGLGQLLDIIQRVRTGLNPKLELTGVMVTMFDGRNSLAQQVVDELQKHFGDKLFKTIVPRNVRLAEAPSYGKAIIDHDKWSKGARAYKALSKEFERRISR